MRKDNKYKLIIIAILVSLVSFVVFLKIKQVNSRPNVILITIDALRADHLGCYGYKRNTSPNIDRLAKEGVIFTQAISQAAITQTSLPSILTALYPSGHGVIDYESALNPSIPNLANILNNNGYYTKTIISHCVPEGIQVIDIDRDFKESTIEIYTADNLTKEAIEFLKDNKKGPFFLYLHYFDTHAPYRSPEPYNKIFLNDELYNKKDEHLPISSALYSGHKSIPRFVVEKNITNVNYYISKYDGAIRFTDEEVGRLLNKIKDLGLDKKTLIIITSDHGESLGEHDNYFMHGPLYDTNLKVPLIVVGSKIIPSGKIISSQVRLIDIMPTTLDILGIEGPKSIDGISLLPLILGEEKCPPMFAFSGHKGIVSVRTEEWKLISFDVKTFLEYIKKPDPHFAQYIEDGFLKSKNNSSVTYLLYNLKNDPQELNNLVYVEKEKFEFLKQKLDNFIISASYQNKKSKVVLDEETKEKLRLLGYVQ